MDVLCSAAADNDHSKQQHRSANGKPLAVTLRFSSVVAAGRAADDSSQQQTRPAEPLHGTANESATQHDDLPCPWEKVLWKQQPYPDNHTDDTFLQHLVLNADVPVRDFWQVALGSAAVTQQLSTVVAAVSVPVHLRLGLLQGHTLLLLNIILLLIGYAVCGLLGGHILGGSLVGGPPFSHAIDSAFSPASVFIAAHRRLAGDCVLLLLVLCCCFQRRGVRQVALLSGGVYLMSPMLHTLTRNVSQDSVIAMIVGLCITHLFLHDYNFVNSVTEQLTGTLSLGAAVFSSVLFASGLNSEFEVFVHVLFCLQLYLLSPFVRRYIRTASLTAHVLLTAAMAAAALLLLAPLSRVVSGAFVAAVLAVSFVCPYWLVRIHKFKAKINGPWDEAVPKMPSSISQRHRRRRQQGQQRQQQQEGDGGGNGGGGGTRAADDR